MPPPEQRPDSSRITRFELVRREGLAAIIATTALLFLSMAVPAPLAPPISTETMLASDSTAPWFFLWVQQLLKFGDPFWMGVFIPAVVFLIFALIPYLLPQPKPEELGRWFPRSGRAAQVLTAGITIILMALTVWGLLSRQ